MGLDYLPSHQPSPGSLIYGVVLLKPTFHQVSHLQNENDSTSQRIVVRINVHTNILPTPRCINNNSADVNSSHYKMIM